MSLKQVTDSDTTVGQSHQAQVTVHNAGLADPDTENVLISGTDPAAEQRAVTELSTRMRALPGGRRRRRAGAVHPRSVHPGRR